MKIIAFYLPQFYAFPENDKWWGKGFTEWTNVKKSKSLFRGHVQPTIPLNDNFCSLEEKSTFEWQISLAKKYGVYGFCFYHYWMGEGRQLMEKPVDMYLANKDLDLPFCLSWANHNWARTWTGGDTDILMDVKYGDEEEWEKHFQYLLPFFSDSRYIKFNEKPLLVIYQPEKIECAERMFSYLNRRAVENGLKGISFISQAQTYLMDKANVDCISKSIQYEPDYSKTCYMKHRMNTIRENLIRNPRFVFNMIGQDCKKILNIATKGKFKSLHLYKYSYDGIWKFILQRQAQENIIPCAFVNYDASPRKGFNSTIVCGFTPNKFGKYLKQLIVKAKNEYHTDYLFLMAWNEWGEGAYVEPNEHNKFSVLENIRNALSSTGELE